MSEEHRNIRLLSKLNLRDLDESADLISDDFVWHYVNPNLPDIHGDYAGVAGLKRFFTTIAGTTGGTFKVAPISATPIGDELVVIHVRDTLELDGKPIAFDAAVVWRVVEGKLAEARDIPSAHTAAISGLGYDQQA